jgi:ABC-type transport system substrate-binding protein
MMRILSVGLVLLCLGIAVSHAQDYPIEGAGGTWDGPYNGVVTLANPSGTTGMGPLNPLFCNTADCDRLVDRMYPSLNLARLTDAGLTEDMLYTPDTITYQLRDDLRWSDGRPVTAYDVFFTFVAYKRLQPLENVIAAAPLDAYTIIFKMTPRYATQPACLKMTDTLYSIVPAHVYSADFTEQVAAVGFTREDFIAQYAQWNSTQPLANVVVSPSQLPTVTLADGLIFDEQQYNQFTRLRDSQSELVLNVIDVSANSTPIEMFLRGDTNLLLDIPTNRWEDVRAQAGVFTYTYPQSATWYVRLNLADPAHPRAAYDQSGAPLAQGVHPLFGDLRVRQALQLATDVNALLPAGPDSGRVLSTYISDVWQYEQDLNYQNTDLRPINHNPNAAIQLLEVAGWQLVAGTNVRTCIGCGTAPDGTAFRLTLGTGGANEISTKLQQQWARIGIDVVLSESVDTSGQRFDAVLSNHRFRQTIPADLWATSADVLGVNDNISSYSNPQMDALVAEYNALPSCYMPERAALQHQIQALLQQDAPAIFLFSSNGMIAARDPRIIQWYID